MTDKAEALIGERGLGIYIPKDLQDDCIFDLVDELNNPRKSTLVYPKPDAPLLERLQFEYDYGLSDIDSLLLEAIGEIESLNETIAKMEQLG